MEYMNLTRVIAALFMAGVLAGCAGGSAGLRAGATSSIRANAPQPGSSYGAASVQVHGSPNAYFGAILLGPVIFGIDDDYRRAGAGPSWRKPPPMAEGRAIAERDCTKPLGPIEGNLRCK